MAINLTSWDASLSISDSVFVVQASYCINVVEHPEMKKSGILDIDLNGFSMSSTLQDLVEAIENQIKFREGII